MANHPDDLADEFIRQFKQAILPSLIRQLPDELFHPGHEVELRRRIVEIIEARLASDKIPIGWHLRMKFIESVIADIVLDHKRRLGDLLS
jgi:hypothetical protein